jgi:transglutaminase-like putative cysteine protease
LLTYWGLESSHRMRSWGRWVSAWAHQKEAEPDAITGELARRLGATAVIFAMVSPLFLPALEDGLLSWRSGIGPSIGQGEGEGGGEGRLNPWVSIVPDIPNQTEDVLFAMEAGLSAYWRIASLEEFDGQNWTEFNDARFDSEQGQIEGQPVPLSISRQITQIIRIEGLRGEFLPAAIKPVAAQRLDVDPSAATDGIDFDPDSGSILLDDDLDEGHTYRITSTIPNVDYEDLVDARPPLPEDINEVYLQGADLSQEAKDLYLGWISEADAVKPFEKLSAVQEGIRGFDYDLEAPALEGDDYVSDFLTRTQTGFCQQFATAFAAIARDLGYPSRVSVGFLPGERAELEGAWVVRGTDAHAWPEVFFENFGWIAFEPTPRNESAPPEYTLRPLTEGSNGSGDEFDPQNPFSDTGQESDVDGAGQGGAAFDEAGGGPGGEGAELPNLRGEELFQAGRGPRGTPAWQRTFTRLVTVAAIAFLLFLLSVPAIKEWRIRRRYREASTPDAVAAAAFVQFEDEAAELAEARAPWESALSYATRMAAGQHVAERSALRLARIYEAAAYAANDISREQAQEARRLAQALRSQLWHQAGWWTKLARLFSPRRLRQV